MQTPRNTKVTFVTGAQIEVNDPDKNGFKDSAQPDYKAPEPKKAPAKKAPAKKADDK